MTVKERPLVRVRYSDGSSKQSKKLPALWQRAGLAVTPEISDERNTWSITQLSSGWAVVNGIRGQRNAIKAAERFLECGDWTRSRRLTTRDRDLVAKALVIRRELRV